MSNMILFTLVAICAVLSNGVTNAADENEEKCEGGISEFGEQCSNKKGHGEACKKDIECASGRCSSSGTCIGGPGSFCTKDTECQSKDCLVEFSSCASSFNGGECYQNWDCENFRCLGASVEKPGSCKNCETDQDCTDLDMSSCKDGHCVAPTIDVDDLLGPGQPCVKNADCLSHVCGSNSTCMKGNVGGLCKQNADCLSNKCPNEDNPKKIVSCTASFNGDPCYQNYDCMESNLCDMTAKNEQGEGKCGPCKKDKQCDHQYCKEGVCTVGYKNGHACEEDFNCYSNYCKEDKCASKK